MTALPRYITDRCAAGQHNRCRGYRHGESCQCPCQHSAATAVRLAETIAELNLPIADRRELLEAIGLIDPGGNEILAKPSIESAYVKPAPRKRGGGPGRPRRAEDPAAEPQAPSPAPPPAAADEAECWCPDAGPAEFQPTTPGCPRHDPPVDTWAEWPPAEPSTPDYLADLSGTLTALHRARAAVDLDGWLAGAQRSPRPAIRRRANTALAALLQLRVALDDLARAERSTR